MNVLAAVAQVAHLVPRRWNNIQSINIKVGLRVWVMFGWSYPCMPLTWHQLCLLCGNTLLACCRLPPFSPATKTVGYMMIRSRYLTQLI